MSSLRKKTIVHLSRFYSKLASYALVVECYSEKCHSEKMVVFSIQKPHFAFEFKKTSYDAFLI